jgi:hypothetical protein
MGPDSSWVEYRRLILSDLRRLEDQQEATHREVMNLRLDVSKLKVHASLWGAAAGAILSLAGSLLLSFLR